MNDKVTLQDLAVELAKRHQLEGADAESFIKMFFTLIEDGLAADKYVKIKGLGAFKLTEVDSRESIDVNTGKRIEIQGYTKVSFTPDAAMKNLINRPFSHFEPVILNEGTTMEAMEAGLQPEEADTEDADESELAGEDIEMEEATGQASAGEEEQSEQDEPAESEKTIIEEEESAAPVVLLTEERAVPLASVDAGPVTEAAESVVSVESEDTEAKKPAEPVETAESLEQTETLSPEPAEPQETAEVGPEVMEPINTPEAADEETNTVIADESENAEPSVEKPVETTVLNHTEVPQEQKRPFCYPWCMIAAILLIGVLVGGTACWILMSGRRYIPENIYRKIMEQEEMLGQHSSGEKPAAGFQQPAADTMLVTAKEADTVNIPVKQQEAPIQQTPRIENKKKTESETTGIKPAAPEKTSAAEENKQGGTATTKVETLADTVEYTIIGTKASHTIQPGESMVKLAARFYGNKKLWPYIARYNRENIKNANNVPVGTVVKIPELKPRKN